MRKSLLIVLFVLIGWAAPVAAAPTFAPHAGLVAPVERPRRAEICLNGRWQFQPAALPAGFRRGASPTPELPALNPDAWETTPIRIPSPWNVNQWGPGRRDVDVGEGTSRLNMLCYVSEQCRIVLNDRELSPARREPADYRTLLHFEGLPLAKGWNHVLIKVAASRLTGARPGTLAVRLQSSQPEYFRQLQSAVERPAGDLHRRD